MIYPKFPTKYIAFTQYFSSKHKAVDIANAVTVGNKKYDNSKEVWMAHEGKIVKNAYASDYGYYVEYEVKDGKDTWLFASGHFDTKSKLEVGKTYPQGTFINKMGSLGANSNGVHDHFRVTKNGVRVDPLTCVYVYGGQTVGTKETAKLLYYTPPKEDNTKQLEKQLKTLEAEIKTLKTRIGELEKEIIEKDQVILEQKKTILEMEEKITELENRTWLSMFVEWLKAIFKKSE